MTFVALQTSAHQSDKVELNPSHHTHSHHPTLSEEPGQYMREWCFFIQRWPTSRVWIHNLLLKCRASAVVYQVGQSSSAGFCTQVRGQPGGFPHYAVCLSILFPPLTHRAGVKYELSGTENNCLLLLWLHGTFNKTPLYFFYSETLVFNLIFSHYIKYSPKKVKSLLGLHSCYNFIEIVIQTTAKLK